MNDYDPEAQPCICPDCPEDAALDSEMCGGCEWLGCSNTRSRHA